VRPANQDHSSRTQEKMISVEKEENCTIFKVTGDVSANEILMQLARYMSGERTDTALWDFTDTRSVKITTVEMKGIADSLNKFSSDEKVRRVAMVGSKTINIGLGKLFAAFAQMAGVPNTYKVFRDIDHAIEWLEGSSDDHQKWSRRKNHDQPKRDKPDRPRNFGGYVHEGKGGYRQPG
jgi:hypothetical protein